VIVTGNIVIFSYREGDTHNETHIHVHDALQRYVEETVVIRRKVQADSPLDHMLEAEERGWQLRDEITVNEQGFDRWDGEVFNSNAIVEAWLQCPLPVV